MNSITCVPIKQKLTFVATITTHCVVVSTQHFSSQVMTTVVILYTLEHNMYVLWLESCSISGVNLDNYLLYYLLIRDLAWSSSCRWVAITTIT